MEMMQKSFIPLCYSMANNEQILALKSKQRRLHSMNVAFQALIFIAVLIQFLQGGDLQQRVPIQTSANATTELAQVCWITASAGYG